MSQSALISTQNHVETPFIIVEIGKYTFGHCSKNHQANMRSAFNLTYPNYMESLNITKINGAINTYVLTMTYAITQHDDPNMLEKVFSSVSDTRMLKLKYGDWNSPSFIYKEEEAIITKLTTKLNMKNSTIQYVINCTSNALTATSVPMSFGAKKAKPSDEIKRLLANKTYGLYDLFRGMQGKDPEMFIDGSDLEVNLEAKPSISLLDYISYLVSCMVWAGEPSSKLKTSCYYWSVYDDVSNKYGGMYFKVVRVASNVTILNSISTYEVDIGYPSNSNVIDFVINTDDSWALLYNYSEDMQLPAYSYYLNDSGDLVQQDTSFIMKSRKTYEVSEEVRDWWSRVTQFPISATLTLKGLLRPAMLMSYVKINTYFYGRKHISSGLYIITKQEDSINSGGYRTTLSLTRVGGDDLYI